jgi:hypothetical protein
LSKRKHPKVVSLVLGAIQGRQAGSSSGAADSFELIITPEAKGIGLTISPNVLARADSVVK